MKKRFQPHHRLTLASKLRRVIQHFRQLLLSLLLFPVFACVNAQELVAIPALRAHVVDQIQLLSSAQQAQLEQTLTDYEQRTGSQIALLLIASTAPEAIEQYSIRVAEAWKLGRKNVDDGVILLVAKDNPKSLHRLRIEAGRGVQGSLTDLQSKRILQEVIAPYFQRNDFGGGLTAGVAAVMTLLDKEQLPAPPPTTQSTSTASDGFSSALPFLLFIAFIALSIWLRRRQGNGALSQGGWGRSAGVILGSGIGFGNDRTGGSSSSASGGMSGGGGSFDGGGASGDW
jgi:uncharacterized protein